MGNCSRKAFPCLKTCLDKRNGASAGDGESGVNCNGERSVKATMPFTPPTVSSTITPALYVALWDFQARTAEEMSLKTGEKCEIVSRTGDWWMAKKIDSIGRSDKGYIPYNYVAQADTVEVQPWFFGKMSRTEALSHLMSQGNDSGAFLVRISESDNLGYVLSVKTNHEVKKTKHFKIYHMADQFYVDSSVKFSSIFQLIEHYHHQPLSTSDLLRQPCIRTRPESEDLLPTTGDEWERPKEEFKLEVKLGSGHFSDVYSGTWKDQIKVAIKVLKYNDCLEQKQFQSEVHIMKRLHHRHLLSLFAICTSSTPYYIITELIEKGDLLNFLKSDEGKALEMEFLIDMASQVADGMAYLEENSSIHRDLAARNVLVGDQYICKIADFGLARIIKEHVYISDEKTIPYKWTAPEAIGHGSYSSKSDVWSFGILLYEIVTYGKMPYPGFRNGEIYYYITQKNYRMPAPPNCWEEIYNIMRSCWRDDPEDRPSFKNLREELQSCQNLHGH